MDPSYVPKSGIAAGQRVRIPSFELCPSYDARQEIDEFSEFLRGQEDYASAQFQAGCGQSAREFVEDTLLAAAREELIDPDVSAADPRVRMVMKSAFGEPEELIAKIEGYSREELVERYGAGVLLLMMVYLDPVDAPKISDFWDISPETAE